MDNIQNKQSVILDTRKSLTIDGIKNVDSFTDEYMELVSNLGIICVEGENLKIEELIQETGKIHISGLINGLFYKEEHTAKGLLSKIFK